MGEEMYPAPCGPWLKCVQVTYTSPPAPAAIHGLSLKKLFAASKCTITGVVQVAPPSREDATATPLGVRLAKLKSYTSARKYSVPSRPKASTGSPPAATWVNNPVPPVAASHPGSSTLAKVLPPSMLT